MVDAPPNRARALRFHVTLTFTSYAARRSSRSAATADMDKIAIGDEVWLLLGADVDRLRSTPVDSGTARDVADNAR
jgi:hypothetical protein